MKEAKPAKKRKKRNWWKYVLAVFLILLYLLPIYVLIMMAFKKMTDLSSYLLPPDYFYLDNFIEIFQSGKVLPALRNTVLITLGVVSLEVIFGCMAAYPLSRNRSRFNNFVYSLCLGAMMIPPLSILVGVYTEMVQLNGINHLWSVIAIAVAFGLPLSINLYVNFIASIPVALDEAATIDGAGVFRTFWHVILPQLKPVTVSVIILKGVAAWNDYLYPSYMLQRPSTYTLVLLIKQYFGSSSTAMDLNSAAAVAVICVAPLIIAYLCLQKYFIQGQIDGAVK